MSNSIRFEFYNNFDIWYDLYQENGGDPNHVIDMLMYSSKNVYGYINEYKYFRVDDYQFGDGYNNIFGYGYCYGYVDIIKFKYINGCGNQDGYKYGFGHGYELKYGRGSLFNNGNGYF